MTKQCEKKKKRTIPIMYYVENTINQIKHN